jgi:hypothetical protein
MRLVLVTGWILSGAAVTGAAYWGFLNTPESTVLALASSALLVLLTLVVLSMTINGAIALWTHGSPAKALQQSITTIPAIVPALLVWALSWWIAASIDTRVALRSGEINAWFIASPGWDDMSWLFTAIGLFTAWLRCVFGALLAISMISAIGAIGWRGVVTRHWFRRALRLRTMIAATLWFVVLIVLPWTYLVPWRPDWVPPTGAELVFIIGKLSVAAFVMAAGVALMIYEVIRSPILPTGPHQQTLAA